MKHGNKGKKQLMNVVCFRKFTQKKSQRQTECNSKQSLNGSVRLLAIIHHTTFFFFCFNPHMALPQPWSKPQVCVRGLSIFLPDCFDDAPRL